MNIYLVAILFILIGFIWLQRKQEIRTLAAKAPTHIPIWYSPMIELKKPEAPKLPDLLEYKSKYVNEEGYLIFKDLQSPIDDDSIIPQEIREKVKNYNTAMEKNFSECLAWQKMVDEEKYFRWKIFYAKQLIKRV